MNECYHMIVVLNDHTFFTDFKRGRFQFIYTFLCVSYIVKKMPFYTENTWLCYFYKRRNSSCDCILFLCMYRYAITAAFVN